MVGVVSVVVSLLLIVAAVSVPDFTPVPNVWILVLGTAAWAAWDSTKIHVREYKTTMASNPLVLFFGIGLLWIVSFPWYLAVRYRITRGSQPRKQSAGSLAAPGPAPGITSAAAPTSSVAAELERLAEMRAQGVLTEEEFSAAKGRVLKTAG